MKITMGKINVSMYRCLSDRVMVAVVVAVAEKYPYLYKYHAHRQV